MVFDPAKSRFVARSDRLRLEYLWPVVAVWKPDQAGLLAVLALFLANPLAVFVRSVTPLRPNGPSPDSHLSSFLNLQR